VSAEQVVDRMCVGWLGPGGQGCLMEAKGSSSSRSRGHRN
jgi:hypothetical protein